MVPTLVYIVLAVAVYFAVLLLCILRAMPLQFQTLGKAFFFGLSV